MMVKKKLSLVTALLLVISMMFTACGGTKGTVSDGTPEQTAQADSTAQQSTAQADSTAQQEFKPDISKEVKLKMYLLSDKPVDADLVYEEVNKKLKQDINATVDVNFISWAEESTKYQLIFASGEDFDLVYTANWENYNQMAVKDAFMPITEEMLRKYAPKTFAEIPKEAWPQTKVNGKVYMIPFTKKEYTTYIAIVRGDLREKYNLPELKSIGDVEKYLAAIAANEKDLIPWADLGYNNCWLVPGLNFIYPNNYGEKSQSTMTYIDQTDKTGKIYSLLDQEFYNKLLDTYKIASDWYKKGFWSKSALTNKSNNVDQLIAGKGAFGIANATNVQKYVTQINKDHPTWKPELFDVNFSKYAFVNSYLSNGMAIHATSKEPERALMMLDLFRNDQSYFDLTTYGVKGKHYNLTDDGKYLGGPDVNNFGLDSGCPWGWRTNLYRDNANNSDSFNKILANFDSKAFIPPFVGFEYTGESMKTELASIKALHDQYYQILCLGMDENPEARMAEWLEKVKAVGYAKVVSDMQNQMNEYLKALGN